MLLAAPALSGQAQPPLPSPAKVSCGRSCPKGTSPGTPTADVVSAWEVEVQWTPAPWATGHAVYRASSPAGPFALVGKDTTPGPALAAQRRTQTSSASAGQTTANGGATHAGPVRATLAPQISAMRAAGLSHLGIPVAYTFDDRSVLPQSAYYYRVHAEYARADSLPGESGSSASVTTPDAVLTGVVAGFTTTRPKAQVAVIWDSLPSGAFTYQVLREGTPIAMTLHDQGAEKFIYDNVPSLRAYSYEVRATSSGRGTPVRLVATTTAAVPADAIVWCRKVTRVMNLTASHSGMSVPDLKTATYSVTVRAVDAVSGQPVIGSVKVPGGTGIVASGQTGQAITVHVCTDGKSTSKVGAAAAARTGADPDRSGKQVLVAAACWATVTAAGYAPASINVPSTP